MTGTSELADAVKEKMAELKSLENEIKKRGIENDDAAIDLLIEELYLNKKAARTLILGICFEHTNFEGAQLPMIAIPRRSLGDRNDWISSWSLGVLTTFCEHEKWKGAEYFALIGDNVNAHISGWGDKISSII